MEADILKAIRTLAFTNALKPDYDFLIRRVQRWYSRAFNTSLLEAEAISEERLFQTWFEDHYDTLVGSQEPADQNQINQIRIELIQSIEIGDGKTIAEVVEEEDDKWHQQMLKEIAEDEAKAAERRKKKAEKKKKAAPDPNLKKAVHVSGGGEPVR